MRKKFWKNCLYASSFSLIVGVGAYTYACADDWFSYSSVSSFTPEAFVDNSYKPMFFAPNERFYNWGYMDNVSMFNNQIVEDWKAYLGNSVPEHVIKEYLVESTDTTDNIRDLYNDVLKKKAKTGTYGLNLKDEKVRNFITFLYFAKEIEIYSAQTINYWDYENHIAITASDRVVNEVESYYNKLSKNDAFFTNRMWFQVMKAKFYSKDRASVISYFEHTANGQVKNTLYYRALGYVAGAYYQQANYAKSNLLYAEVFNAEPSMRQVALYNFKPLDNKQLQNVISSTNDKEVKAAIWAITGHYKSAAEAMKEVYAIDPNSKHIDYLLTRWVNEQESAVNVFAESSFKSKDEYFKAIKKKIDANTLKWVKQVANNTKDVHNPVLWKLAAGYMDIFQGNYSDAEKLIREAKSSVKGYDQLLVDQVRLFGLINTVSQVKKIDKAVEKSLITDLKWVYNDLPNGNGEGAFRYEYASNWIRQFLAAVYQEQGNLIMSELLLSNGSSFYQDAKRSNEMEAFFKKTNKSEIESLFASHYSFNLSDIYESRAIYLFYQDRLEEAIVEMEKAAPIKKYDSYNNEEYIVGYREAELYGNPFNGKIKDCNDCDHAAKQSVKYSKLAFLKKVKEMQDNVNSGNDVFNNAMLLGNAYYNTTYFGNARMFYYNNIVGEYGSNSIISENKSFLLSMKLAQKYYNIAKANATTREQKAKLAYFDAKIERNTFYVGKYHTDNYYYGAWGDDVMFKKWRGFAELQTKYSDTKYYKEVINECGYFRKYLGME
ncbi:hypothetical protein [Myroides phaeus]|uniref:Tetratricopeptide repeat-containing protein n=1 Tax=Myroides phaeus TaxID=702745 RepID=A0A1G8BQT6_9FLAO|nr:hypothetical protein [Myroides phaeus]SDH35552.1 hypothetical protein SAMN05421818_102190 [Myroides phaeus]